MEYGIVTIGVRGWGGGKGGCKGGGGGGKMLGIQAISIETKKKISRKV